MSAGDSTPSVELSHYWLVLRRLWWVVVLSTVIGLGLALAYLSMAPKTASATAVVALNVISADPFNVNRAASGLIDATAEAQVASSFAVAERASESLGGARTAEEIRRSVEVSGVADTAILRITASAPTANAAQATANAVATGFLDFRSEQAEARIGRTLAKSEQRLDQLREDLREVDEWIADAEPGSPDEIQALSDRSVLTLQINAVLSETASTENIDTSGGSILSPADRNPVSWDPQPSLVLASGLAAGLGLGIVAAFALGALRARVRTARDVARNGGRELLGELSQRQVTIPPTGQDLEELRAARERILANGPLVQRKGVLTVIDYAGDASTGVTAAGLGYVMALTGTPVEYVAPMARTDELTALVAQLHMHPGTTESATGVRYTSQSAQPFSFSIFVPHGAGEGLADEPFSGAVREEVVSRSEQALVILAVDIKSGEPALLAASRLADSVLFVLPRGGTLGQTVQRVSRDARAMGAHIAGSIMVPRHRVLAEDTRRLPTVVDGATSSSRNEMSLRGPERG